MMINENVEISFQQVFGGTKFPGSCFRADDAPTPLIRLGRKGIVLPVLQRLDACGLRCLVQLLSPRPAGAPGNVLPLYHVPTMMQQFKVILDHVFWGQWKGDKLQNNTIQ